MSNSVALKTKIKKVKETVSPYIYVAPVLIGIFLFTVIPIVYSLVMTFMTRELSGGSVHYVWNNFQNWKLLYDDRADVFHSLYITFRYAVIMVISGMVGSYFLALLLNRDIRGVKVFRVLLYIPSLIPAIAGTYLGLVMTDTAASGGYINIILRDIFHLSEFTFYRSGSTVFLTIILLSIPGWGASTIMWLAQLKNIPRDLYEAADIDGAGIFQKLFKITIPLSSPMIFYVLITSIIGALQVFAGYFPIILEIMDDQVTRELWFFVIKIYATSGIGDSISGVSANFGYACVLSWVLFIIIGFITVIQFKFSGWVQYGEDV